MDSEGADLLKPQHAEKERIFSAHVDFALLRNSNQSVYVIWRVM